MADSNPVRDGLGAAVLDCHIPLAFNHLQFMSIALCPDAADVAGCDQGCGPAHADEISTPVDRAELIC
jgi:hypothetical protein